MECKKLLEKSVVLEIMRDPGKIQLQNKLFDCIYSEYEDDFIDLIMNKYSYCSFKDKLEADAENAFQEGVLAFYLKCHEEGFILKASLKTYLYRVCLNHLLITFRRDRETYGIMEYTKGISLFLKYWFDAMLEEHGLSIQPDSSAKIDLTEIEKGIKEPLKEVLAALSQKQRHVLIMRFLLKWDSKQIAEELKITADPREEEAAKGENQIKKAVNKEIKKAVHGFGDAYQMMFCEMGLKSDTKTTLENLKEPGINETEKCIMEVLALVLKTLPEDQEEIEDQQNTEVREDILIMKFVQKLRSKQIAEKLGIAAGTVDNIASKAYKKIRILLKAKCNF